MEGNMLGKRTRSVQKDQHQMENHIHNPQQISDSGSESSFHSDGGGNNKNLKNNSFYTSIPGLLVGLSPKGLALTDCDSVRSPTSPLDFRFFSGLGNPFRSSSSSSSSSTKFSFSHEIGQQRSWVGPGFCGGGGGSKLGLISIIDSLDDGDMKSSGKVLRSSSSESSKNILFGPKLRVVNKTPRGQPNEKNTNPFGSSSPKSLPKNYAIFPHSSKPKSPLQKGTSDVLFEIGDIPSEPDSFGKIRSYSLDSCGTISNLSGLRNHLDKRNNHPNSSPTYFSLEGNKNNGVTAQVSSHPQFIGGSPNSDRLSGTKVMSTIPGNGFIGSLSASEIELSEDYTCVISHGPNPKTTHIFGDCILETHSNDLSNFGKIWDNNNNNKEVELSYPIINTTNSEISVQYPSDDFLSFCYSCNKKLEVDKDIYMYRGEKAFCSLNCRSLEILIDEKLEKSSDKDSETPVSPLDVDDEDDCKELFFEAGLVATT